MAKLTDERKTLLMDNFFSSRKWEKKKMRKSKAGHMSSCEIYWQEDESECGDGESLKPFINIDEVFCIRRREAVLPGNGSDVTVMDSAAPCATERLIGVVPHATGCQKARAETEREEEWEHGGVGFRYPSAF